MKLTIQHRCAFCGKYCDKDGERVDIVDCVNESVKVWLTCAVCSPKVKEMYSIKGKEKDAE